MGSENLMDVIAEVFGVTREEMLSGKREHRIVVPVMMYSVLRYRQIADDEGWARIISREINRHRTTVYHHIDSYEKSCQTHYEEIRALEERLETKIIRKWY